MEEALIDYERTLVAPRAGAWIETLKTQVCAPLLHMSRPVRARGLKLMMGIYRRGTNLSRPVRARGLKPRTGRDG